MKGHPAIQYKRKYKDIIIDFEEPVNEKNKGVTIGKRTGMTINDHLPTGTDFLLRNDTSLKLNKQGYDLYDSESSSSRSEKDIDSSWIIKYEENTTPTENKPIMAAMKSPKKEENKNFTAIKEEDEEIIKQGGMEKETSNKSKSNGSLYHKMKELKFSEKKKRNFSQMMKEYYPEDEYGIHKKKKIRNNSKANKISFNKINERDYLKKIYEEMTNKIKTYEIRIDQKDRQEQYFGNCNRYSKRVRIPRLNHLAGERISYERSFSGGFQVKSIFTINDNVENAQRERIRAHAQVKKTHLVSGHLG